MMHTRVVTRHKCDHVTLIIHSDQTLQDTPTNNNKLHASQILQIEKKIHIYLTLSFVNSLSSGIGSKPSVDSKLRMSGLLLGFETPE